VFAGNCQARALGTVYKLHVAPLRGETVRLIELHPGLDEQELAAPLAEVYGADVVVEQRFDFPSRIPPDFLRPAVTQVAFPYVGGAFYWPFAMEPHILNQPEPLLNNGVPYPGEISDRILNRMIREKVPPEEAAQRYLEMDVPRIARIERLMEMHLGKQRQRDAVSGIKTADYIVDNFCREKLFLTTGHPALPLFRVIARQVFGALGVPAAVIETTLQSLRLPPYPLDEAPIHPALAAHLRLDFADATTRYRFRHEGRFTFAEYVRRYLRHAWDSELEEGIALTHRGESARAAALLHAGLQRCPESLTGWQSLAMALAGVGRFDSALEALDRAGVIDPADPETPQIRARVFLRQGLIPQAIDAARKAIDLFPLEAGSQRVFSQVVADSGDLLGSASIACLALKLAPGDPANSWLLSSCLCRLGDLTGAEAILRDALALEPERDDLRAALIDILSRAGRAEEAAQLIEALSATESMSPRLYGQIGTALSRSHQFVEAAAAFRRATELEPSNEGYYGGLADALFRGHRFEAALEVTSARIEAGTRDPHMHHRHGLLLSRASDMAGAEAAWRTAIALDPSIGGFFVPVTEMLIRQGRLREAEQMAETFAATGSRDATTYHRMGLLLAQAGLVDKASAAIRRAIELDNSVPAFHAALSQIA
jgi:tetratricopeptide (TPR) repeat protein